MTRDPLAVPTLPLRLDLDQRAVREAFALRTGAAAIAFVAGLWMAWMRTHWWVALAGAAASGFSAIWWFRGLRERQRALDVGEHVWLDGDGVTHHRVGPVRRVGWDDVVRVRVDEDRLVVVIETRSGGNLQLEPIYGGLGVYDLQATMTGAWRTARPAHADASPMERG